MTEKKCDGCGALIAQRPAGLMFIAYRNFVQFENEHYDFCDACMGKLNLHLQDQKDFPLLRDKIINKRFFEEKK